MCMQCDRLALRGPAWWVKPPKGYSSPVRSNNGVIYTNRIDPQISQHCSITTIILESMGSRAYKNVCALDWINSYVTYNITSNYSQILGIWQLLSKEDDSSSLTSLLLERRRVSEADRESHSRDVAESAEARRSRRARRLKSSRERGGSEVAESAETQKYSRARRLGGRKDHQPRVSTL